MFPSDVCSFTDAAAVQQASEPVGTCHALGEPSIASRVGRTLSDLGRRTNISVDGKGAGTVLGPIDVRDVTELDASSRDRAA